LGYKSINMGATSDCLAARALRAKRSSPLFSRRSRRFEVTATRVHPETGKTLRRGTRPRTVVFGSLSRVVEVPGWYPEDDSDSIHTGVDLKASDEAFRELRTAHAGRVKSVRISLKLTQEEAGRIIGGGRRAFQKYESGKTPPIDAAVGLLEVLSRHPEEINMLRQLREPAPQSVISKVAKRRPGGARKEKSPSRSRSPAHP
jgi:HTH-type transcriptional regulator / antitoxin MqsA